MQENENTAWGNGNALLSPHFFFNTLNIIQYFIMINDRKGALICLNKFSKLFRQYIVLSQSKIISIDEEIKMIRLFLQLQQLRFANKFSFQIVYHKSFQHSKIVPVVQWVVIIEDIIDGFLKNGEKHIHLSVSFNVKAEKIIMILEAGDFMDDIFIDKPIRVSGHQEPSTRWRNFIGRYNCKSKHQISYSEERLSLGNKVYPGYMRRIVFLIPCIE